MASHHDPSQLGTWRSFVARTMEIL
ncbi:hypothetical protein DFAR_3970010 [Desulfarculales bacterium]